MIYNWELYKPQTRVYLQLELPGRTVIRPAVQKNHDEKGFWVEYRYAGQKYEAYHASHDVKNSIWARPYLRLVHGSANCCDMVTGQAFGQGGEWNMAARLQIAERTNKAIHAKKSSMSVMKIMLIIGVAIVGVYLYQTYFAGVPAVVPGA